MRSSQYIFESLKNFLIKNNKINNDWNALNILSNNASTVGSYDLTIFSSNNGRNLLLEKLNDNSLDLLFLIGQDKLKIKKKELYVVYVGSHGDEGAKNSDLILPGSAYTEQDGYFTNLEGKFKKLTKLLIQQNLPKKIGQSSMKLQKLFAKKSYLKIKMI